MRKKEKKRKREKDTHKEKEREKDTHKIIETRFCVFNIEKHLSDREEKAMIYYACERMHNALSFRRSQPPPALDVPAQRNADAAA